MRDYCSGVLNLIARCVCTTYHLAKGGLSRRPPVGYPACPALERLFAPENPIIPVRSEAALGQHFAAATMIPVTMLLLEEAARWLGEQCGDMRAAEIYVAALLSGYLAEVPQDGNGRFSEAVEELATEGGISAQIVNHLRDAGVLANLRDGLTILGQRLRGD